VRAEPGRQTVNLGLKISPLVATIFRSFSGNETSNYGGIGGRVVTYLCKQTVWTSQWHEDVLQVCGNRSSPLLPLPFPSLPLEVGPLLQAGALGKRFRQTLFGEFEAKNLASGSNDLQELFRK